MNEARIRKLNDMRSSIFEDRSSTPVETSSHPPPTHLKARASTPSLRSSKPLQMTPQVLKQMNMNMYYPQHYPAPSQARIETFQIQGLTETSNDQTLKRVCSEFHIIQAQAQINNLNGKCTGKGIVKIRSLKHTDRSQLKSKIEKSGLKIKETRRFKGKKTDPFGKSFLQIIQPNKQQEVFSGCQSSWDRKVNIMKSSDDLFGNSKGVGRVVKKENTPVKDRSCQNLMVWNRVRKICVPESLKVQRSSGFPRYMKSTVASNGKFK